MKEEILNILKKSASYVSGEDLSAKLHVSRTAIWKHIKTLKAEGYVIDGVSNKGYKLISSPDRINKPDLFSFLTTEKLGRNLIHYDTLDSTMNGARDAAKKNCPDGTIVTAEQQTGGTGRFKRPWNGPLGGLWFTLVLYPDIPTAEAPKITQIAGASLLYALKEKYNIETKIKWPNDIYLNGKKLCGILAQMSCDMDSISYMTLGIGINVNFDMNEMDKDVQKTATSIFHETKNKIDRNELLAEFLNVFETEYNKFVNSLDMKKTIEICRHNSMIWGKQAKLITFNNEEIVTCVDLTDDGTLIVEDKNGILKPVLSGEISFKGLL